MPAVKLDRLETGVAWFDQWIDSTLSAIERALNVTSSGPIATNVRPDGISLAFTGSYFALAKSSGTGIPAMSGTAPGSADVTLYTFNGTDVATQTITDKAYNLSATAVGNNKLLILCRIEKWWFVIFEDCT